ncbi:unnamed protein product [Caenorhabditis auriculariae]|uniref:Uncharacterized protein n=1 Tax=Caenorhabditis auriculariae TaxID=2777116 RepID=A0A8S1HQ39_9PELO|nr:unnamed protein product [Caenorhabditis auriculariae]
MESPINDRHFRCFFGWFHALLTIKIVLSYFVAFNIGLSFLRLPTCSIYTALVGLSICLLTMYPILRHNSALLLPFYLYVVSFQNLYDLLPTFHGRLLFFFVNIFYKEHVAAAFGDNSETLSFAWHLVDILLILLHFWTLSVISKCRRYFDYCSETHHKLEIPVRRGSRNNSKPEIV